MGKIQDLNLHQQQRHAAEYRDSSGLICSRCSVVFSRVAKEFNFKCLFILIMALSILLFGIFCILPHRVKSYAFDAKEEIKLSASVQAYFRLEKPVSHIVPHIERLEDDINAEIGVPEAKVAILSVHQSGVSNWTDVIFGVLSDPINTPMNPVSLSVLKSSLIEVFLLQPNLTLTTSIFGQPSMFQIIKFEGGVTLIPPQIGSLWQMPQILFNFTINNSISDLLGNFSDLKNQLKFGLHLKPSEDVYVQITNLFGSTKDPPVIVQASVLSDVGGLLPQRLKQLAQTITGSPTKNLGLDNSIFGKVKSISLSSFLKGTLSGTPPSYSPAPGPELIDYAEPSSSPSLSPSANSPSLSPSANSPSLSPDIDVSSQAPSMVVANPPNPCLYSGSKFPPSSSPNSPSNPTPTIPPVFTPNAATPYSSPRSRKSFISPNVSPPRHPPDVSHASSPDESTENTKDLLAPLLSPSSSSSASPFFKAIWLLGFTGLVIFLLFSWPH